MSFEPLACMLCGAAGGRELFLAILTVFLLMFAGSVAMLASQVAGGDWADVASRNRPLEAEEEATAEDLRRREAVRG